MRAASSRRDASARMGCVSPRWIGNGALGGASGALAAARVAIVSSGCAAAIAADHAGAIAASGDRSRPVPTWTADAPSIRAAETVLASVIPPVAITGQCGTASTRAGIKASRPTPLFSALPGLGEKQPLWPPASTPCAMRALQPASAAARASATVVTVAHHGMPCARKRSTKLAG
eukprot:3391499-Prymnesium_polylepis.1